MCTPAKRLATGVDVLDLSHTATLNATTNPENTIVLSEDDEEKVTPSTSDTEKENAPYDRNRADIKSLRISLENDLRQEEAALQILQKLRESQNPNSPRSSSKSNLNASNSSSNLQSNVNSTAQTTASASASALRTTSVAQQPKVTIHQAIPQSNSPVPVPKVTKQAALQSLEQFYATKKTVLRKHLERNLDKINLPRPTAGTGLCEVAFIPSTLTAEFTSLLGLEEVVKTIQDFDPSNLGKHSEPKCTFSPFSCVKCGTDFTPVWKREKPGSTSVVCEACLMETQCTTLQKEYEESVQQVLQQQVTSEQEIEREYQDTVSTPAKLDAYIKEQEKKLLATHQAQQQLAQQQAAYNQRYSSKSGNTAGARQSPTIASGTNSVAAVAHQRSRTAAAAVQQAASAVLGSQSSSGGVASVAANSSAAAAAHAAAAQLALQQYAKAINQAGGAAVASNPALNATTAALMMAAVANNQQAAAVAAQQQQQQHAAQAAAAAAAQQQRLVAAQLLSGIQAQQQALVAAAVAAGGATDSNTTLNRIQSLLMSSGLLNGGDAQNASARQQLMQYLILQQQQQQQQQAAAAQAAQQNAALTQFLSQIQSNPSAYVNFMQLWASGLGGGTGSSANGGVKK